MWSLDEVAHYEPPHQDLGCLQSQLFSSLILKVGSWSFEWSFECVIILLIYLYKLSESAFYKEMSKF